MHKAHVAWDEITRPKNEGGLGIKKLSKWSKAAAFKHLWHIVLDSVDNMWTAWVHMYLLKGRGLWFANPPTKCSWI